MGCCSSADQEESSAQRKMRAAVQASPPLLLNMEAPTQCEVVAHEAETVQELLETLAVSRFGLRKADARRLTLEFGEEPMERQQTLGEIGMCDQARISVLGITEPRVRAVS